MMKKNISILFMLCLCSFINAQKMSVKQANALFERRSYVKAAEAYEQLKPTKEILQNLGDSYFYNNQMNKAAEKYGQLYENYKGSIKPEYLFRYANALKGIKNTEKGDAIMSEYLGKKVNTPSFVKSLVRNVPFNYTVKQFSKSSLQEGDFGMSYFGDKLVFASSRNTDAKIYAWDNKPFLDLYSANVDKSEQLVNIEPFGKNINSKFHESSATFNAAGNVMYFNRTGKKKVEIGDDKYATIKIYRAELINGKWDNVKELPFSSENYTCEHPTLSKDGKKLYFASDMPGTLGSLDIFVVDVNDDGTYGVPQNLGDKINTPNREQFPFISDNNVLYFSSDGHQGLGNMDIFMSKISSNGKISRVVNLGSSINSEMDDFAFIVNDKENSGYFSSNRTGVDLVYKFVRVMNELQYVVEGILKDKNSSVLLSGTTVTLYDDKGKQLDQTVTDKDATFIFDTEPNKKYKIVAQRDFYVPLERTFETTDSDRIYLNIEMLLESYSDAEKNIKKKDDGSVQIELDKIHFDTNKWDIKPNAATILNSLVNILNKYPEMEIELNAHTDSRSTEAYNLMLSEKRAKATLDYLVQNGISPSRLTAKGYGESMPLIKCGDKCTEEEHAINRRCEFIILKKKK